MKKSIPTKKAALELSVTMLVVIIISVVVFAAGIVLVWKTYGGAKQVQAEIERSTQEQIEALLKSGKSLVAIPINEKSASAGQQVVFGVGIRNVGVPEGVFSIRVSFDGAYYLDGTQIQGLDAKIVEEKWLGRFSKMPNLVIEQNDYRVVPVLVKAQSGPKGKYVFNVCVFTQGDPTEECRAIVAMPDNLYDKMYQITVNLK